MKRLAQALGSFPARRWVPAVVGCLCLTTLSAHAQPEPYSVDANTLHLWHFDEVQNTNAVLPELLTLDDVSFFSIDLSVTNGARLEAASFAPGLNGALDTEGIPGSPPGQPGAFGPEDFGELLDVASPGGAFTYEALILPAFDPTAPLDGRTNAPDAMQILSFENEGGIDERVFQFRLTPPASNEQWSLEFLNVGSVRNEVSTNTFVGTVIDDFESDTSASYTQYVVLDNGRDADTSSSDSTFTVSGGTASLVTTIADDVEQHLIARNGLSLAVGEEVQLDLVSLSTSNRDMGLFVGNLANLVNVTSAMWSTRSNFVYITVGSNLSVGGFDESGSILPTERGGTLDSITDGDTLFIARTAADTYELGHYDNDNGGQRLVRVTQTGLTGNDASAVGFWADIRAAGTLSTFDNLRAGTNTTVIITPGFLSEGFSAPLPTNGLDAAAQSNWFHVAVTYTGQEDTAGNLNLYWTELSRAPSSASLLGSFQMINDLLAPASGSADLAVGNEGRQTPGGNFVGRLDEVQISATARAADFFQLDGTPYTADGDTLHLYHFDEANPANFPTNLLNDAVDEVGADPIVLAVQNGAVLGAAAWSGAFGTAMDSSSTNTAGAFAAEDLPVSAFVNATTGAFTFEALVQPGFDPATTTDADGFSMILSLENEGGTVAGRPMQFRVRPPAAAGGDITLDFINIDTASGALNINRPLPTSGPHALVQGGWYHVAVTFTGDTNATDNLVLYWTALDSGAITANALLTTNMPAPLLISNTGDFAVGNTGRAPPNGNFLGVVDEVRISDVARGPNQFLLSDLVLPPEIRAAVIDAQAGTIGLTWTSDAGSTYTINRSTNLLATSSFAPVKTGISGDSTQTTDAVSLGGGGVEAYQIEVE